MGQRCVNATRWACTLVTLAWLVGACSSGGTVKGKTTGPSFGKGDVPTQLDSVDAGEEDIPPVFDINFEPTECASPGTWGCPCKGNDDCTAGFCVDSEKGKVCTMTCSQKCPKDWKCLQAAGATDLTYVCVPIYTNLCKPCKSHEECKSAGFEKGENLCIPLEGADGFVNGSFCGTLCASDEDCKGGYHCKDVELPGAQTLTTKQCLPDSNDCGCLPAWVALQNSTSCSKTNAFGSCSATRSCTDEGLTLCSAPTPTAETCDGEDNDCNGKTDEAGAVGCVVYFADNDGDGAGIGDGVCSCNNPGAGYASSGGDCNDLVAQIKPGADEICDDIDNNCNGDTDEAGAKGCKIFYKDKDGDGFGDPADSGCLCPSKATKDWIGQAGDCDDANDTIHPGVVEVCDNLDNNCNAKIDEEGAQGCTLFYLDIDNDGFGPAASGKCLCAKGKIYSTDQAGDCDDNAPAIHPTANEVCNGIDEDCNGITDDGDAVKGCPAVPDGSPGCSGGKCTVGKCKKGLFDVNGTYDDGCECAADNNYGISGSLCAAPTDLGNVPDGSATILKSGNVMPGEDGDWFKINAIDQPDGNGGCDSFDVRAKFLANPGDQFALDFYRGGCAGADQLCSLQAEVGWNVSYSGPAPNAPPTANSGQTFGDGEHKYTAPANQSGGECKCTGAPGLPGMNICTDNSAVFYVRVYRKPGLPATCDLYTIAIDNSPGGP
jgi:hypothetical protein